MEIEDGVLSDLSRLLNEKKKSPAVARAVAEFVRQQKAKEFARLLREGEFDYPVTNEEMERQQG